MKPIAQNKCDALDPDRIKSHLRTKRVGQKVVVYNSTASTNDVAAQYAKNKNNDGIVVLAEEQGKGRGRGGNKWVAGFGDSADQTFAGFRSAGLTDRTQQGPPEHSKGIWRAVATAPSALHASSLGSVCPACSILPVAAE